MIVWQIFELTNINTLFACVTKTKKNLNQDYGFAISLFKLKYSTVGARRGK